MSSVFIVEMTAFDPSLSQKNYVNMKNLLASMKVGLNDKIMKMEEEINP